jgi:hypothetical protein
MMEKEEKNYQLAICYRSANIVPRDRGVREAARGLERELKCLVATQKAQW